MPPPGASAAEFIHLYFRNSFSGQHMVADPSIRLRPLEREDLPFIHQLDNNASVMRYWFEEPYEAFVELTDLYDKHIHDQSERRFTLSTTGPRSGWSNLSRSITSTAGPNFRSSSHPRIKGSATRRRPFCSSWTMRLRCSISINCTSSWNTENKKAIHVYKKLGFEVEGELKHEFFSNGEYRNALRMCTFQTDYLMKKKEQAAQWA